MNTWDALILGIVQGLTEFLPVSSSGHLELGKALLGDDSLPQESLLFTVVLHAATALSTIVVFRKDVLQIVGGLFRLRESESVFSLKILISMVPAAMVGYFLDEEMELLFGGNVVFVGFMLLVTGLLLFLAGRAKNTDKSVSTLDAVLIGLSQAIAILPGISRSGATISTSVLLGVDRGRAARFSFLMVVPLILGKIAKDVLSGDLNADSMTSMPILVGFAAAFITGLLACTWMIQLVKRMKLHWFSYYCFVVGLIAIAFGLYG